MSKMTILDCYTDEPSGLGVPPYLGVYPRYIAGKLYGKHGKVNYITIDDLRLYKVYKKHKGFENEIKTNIKIYNLTNQNIGEILKDTKTLIVVLGVHTPGKYLSAVPGTLKEITKLIEDLKCKKILTGPSFFGTQLQGGRKAEKLHEGIFDEIVDCQYSFEDIKEYAVKGAYIAAKIPNIKMIEIETGRGCLSGRCSFCTEPLKADVYYREQEDIHNEIKEFYKLGERFFRLGKQTCFFSYKFGKVEEIEKLLKPIANLNLRVLHIDNVNPVFVNEERAKLVVKYCTPGNVAAFGAETFDDKVIKINTLNSPSELTYKAVKIINDVGSKRGSNGMPCLLPGINILFGLKGETEETHKKNLEFLQKILDENLLLRRINIRQVVAYPGTKVDTELGTNIKKNKKRYWSWRKEIREKIDYEMLKRLVPKGTILKEVYTETYDGNTTFSRQLGSYPLIIGIKGRLPLRKFVDVKVKDWMLRSIVGEINEIEVKNLII